ncbi:50S ribosomal protein L21 [secondary endosymbiont of Trabutina mannipara]|uniref:Large ribosomal subunit protein bL21 n=1 Tax=secondary endosymbiont of Trabutina mannipara TaxID=1835721 RepID=A0A1C3L3P0_9ENTR|nr:50S ribosomal protein L21 [secondary endosymbiont of Trabutina mannipara]SBT81891.1 50S ribosomal protein L21 [secondary endosymbiont of Trabutina mannipara]
MYAVFQAGGKQHRVVKNQIIRIEKLNILVDKIIEFNQIIMIVNHPKIQIGNPFLIKSKIIAKIIAHGRYNKIMIIKFNRRKHYRKHIGHHQLFTDIKISDIVEN